jgi:hypothetical protein
MGGEALMGYAQRHADRKGQETVRVRLGEIAVLGGPAVIQRRVRVAPHLTPM